MRKENSIKNFLTNIIPFFILTILGFLRLKVLLNSLGEDIYALNQLFIQIFSYISLLEAGVGTLIIQMYYQHLVKEDRNSINSIYTSSKKMLNKLSIAMLIIGFFISFFLGYLTNNNLSLIYMQIVFILYLFRSVLEYFTFSPRFLLMADQKTYKINIVFNLFKIIEIIFEIIILQFYKNYIIILLSSTILRYISYNLVNRKVYKEYPWLRVVKNDKNIPIKGMGNVIVHKLSGTVFSNTDILLASAFLEPIAVVIYSSYNYIIKFISDAVYMIVSSITASMGNVMYKDEKKYQYAIFEKTNSLFLFLAVVLPSALFVSMNRFVQLWLGEDKIMPKYAFGLLIATLFISIVNKPFLIIRDSKSLYGQTKLIAFFEAIINLILSIILIKVLGITGLILATVIASLCTSLIFYPKYIYKNEFNISSKYYFLYLSIYIIFTIILCFSLSNINYINITNNYIYWFLSSLLYFIIILFVTFLFQYIISKNFRDLCKEIFNYIINVIRKT